MDYEKKYKEALSVAKTYHDCSDGKLLTANVVGLTEAIFPELKESEDEKIIDAIKLGLKCLGWGHINGIRIVDIIAWLEKQDEKNVPLREMVLNVWELGNIWKEITKGVCNTEHGTQLEFIIKHWNEGEHYTEWIEKQGEQKSVEYIKDEALSKLLNKVICYFINNPDIPYSERDEVSVKLIPYVEMLEKQGEKKPALSEDDEKIRKELMDFVVGNTISKDGRREIYLAWLEKQCEPQDKGEISDGYHTFNELYYYRMLYNAAFFNMLPKEWVHKSKRHNDGEECFGGGWFIVMANLPTGQISNHYELKDWDLFQIPEKEVADKWDGHTPQEAADRLHKYLLEKQGEQKGTLCDTCRKAQPSHSCQDITALGRCALEKQGEQNLANSTKTCKDEQKPTWSEEDEHRVEDTIYFLETAKKHYASDVELNACIDWIKSIKDRI